MHSSALFTLASLLVVSAHPSPAIPKVDVWTHPHLYHRNVAPIRQQSPRAHRAAAGARDISVESGDAAKGHLGFPPVQDAVGNNLHQAPGARMVRRRKRSCIAGSNTQLAVSAPSSTPVSVDNSSAFSTTMAEVPASSTIEAAASSSAAASAAPSSTSGSSGSGSSSGTTSAIFPIGTGSASWTTDTDSSSAMSFPDAIKPLSSGHLPDTVSAPDGSQALSATYPAGIVGLKNGGGFNFYSEGQHNNVNVEGASEVTFTYSVYFPEDFDFVKGGKLPGFEDNVEDNGMGEIYNYLPVGAHDADPDYCTMAPFSTCNPDYGDSVARGAFTFPKGAWTTVAQRLKMNDMGQSNGEQELYVNGESKILISNLAIAQEEGTKIYGIMAQTFFGGSTSDYAPSSDMTAYFKDWSLAVNA